MDTLLDWDLVCDDPKLQNLPFKVEINSRGNLEMSPSRPRHGEFQLEIGRLLKALLPDGRSLAECPILLSQGVRVPDVAWIRMEREQYNLRRTALTVAPDICVEVLSLNNTLAELEERRVLYSEKGAIEFWTCSEMGTMEFFDAARGVRLAKSQICPEFPSCIQLP